MRNRGRLILGVALVAAFALTGCAGKVRLASSKTCAAHGGTYDASAKSCTFDRVSKSAASICQAQGGFYDTGADFCEIGND